VGRFFADHPHAPVALVALPSRAYASTLYRRRDDVAGTAVRAAFVSSDELERGERLLRFSVTFDPVEEDPSVDRDSTAEKDAERTGSDVIAVERALSGTTDRRLFSLYMRTEQAPNPDSRVTLSDERDRLGLPKARLNWQLSELDRTSVARSVRALAQALGAAGLGRLYSRPATEETFWNAVGGGNHHMGTARMHPEPSRGVVDENCRIHGVANMYVAGSAVFPTTGFAHPTLTVVALALRLADHLRTELG
jgi:choline dehydrogenase-like flavoprotein